ncbi:hypothetical protein BV25DRAFT_1371081 [Artomyces pyxidatus]|uniref:Uncharacterized protein n=1 Tax=Artomyces pyxidatus TaxID=48021 RepID=A0ACB8SMK7_9AGAM|nr:hypothetical protein BV25DRAFT_1371081 [Artomyces pyxidatus]
MSLCTVFDSLAHAGDGHRSYGTRRTLRRPLALVDLRSLCTCDPVCSQTRPRALLATASIVAPSARPPTPWIRPPSRAIGDHSVRKLCTLARPSQLPPRRAPTVALSKYSRARNNITSTRTRHKRSVSQAPCCRPSSRTRCADQGLRRMCTCTHRSLAMTLRHAREAHVQSIAT